MLAELAQLALILAFVIALLQGLLPVLGSFTRDTTLLALARPAAWAQLGLLAAAAGALVWLCVQADFSVLVVATHVSSALPLRWRIPAAWAGQEGSLLLWALLLAGWGAAASLAHSLPADFRARALAASGLINAGVLGLLLFACNPFARLQPAPADGNSLNPLLLDPAMTIHPPLLYLGYAGLGLVCALAIAARTAREADPHWPQRLRPWLAAAWSFLTLGMLAGAFWADHVAGWGWWSWDPVENTSLLPWLAATALLHLLPLARTRGRAQAAAAILAAACFALVLLGIFLSRAGALASVHAFADSRLRSLPALLTIALLAGLPLLLCAWPRPALRVANTAGLRPHALSLLGIVLLLAACAVVMLGTFLPAFAGVSVGSGYFPAVFLPLMLPALLLMVAATFRRRGAGLWLAHLGVLVFALSAAVQHTQTRHTEAVLAPGGELAFAGHRFVLQQVSGVREAGHLTLRAQVQLTRNGNLLAELAPERRLYPPYSQPLSALAVYRSAAADFQLELSETDSPARWRLRLTHKPLQSGIWAGVLMMVVAGALAAWQPGGLPLPAPPASHDAARNVARHRRLLRFLLPWSVLSVVLLYLLLGDPGAARPGGQSPAGALVPYK